uniref:Uncharacterized protein n=1 Tax=Aegilops tauschii TaxID=37682 RepID=R7WEJ7_AEGTA
MASMKKFIEVTVDDLQERSRLDVATGLLLNAVKADGRNSVVDIVEIRFKGLEDAQQPNRRLVLSKRRGQLKQISGRHRLPVLPELSEISLSVLLNVKKTEGSKIVSLMRGAMLWITRRLSRRSGGEYGAHNHQFITMKQKKWYSFAMLDFGSRCSSAINRRYSRCHHSFDSFAAMQASDEEARNGGGHITICRRGERHTYPLTIEMQVQGKHLVSLLAVLDMNLAFG